MIPRHDPQSQTQRSDPTEQRKFLTCRWRYVYAMWMTGKICEQV